MNRDSISLEGVNLDAQVPLITAPVGYGKSYFAINELPQLIAKETGRKIENVLYLTPTRAILEQVAKQYQEKTERASWFDYVDAGKCFGVVRVACFASPASFLFNQNDFKQSFDLLIVDEADLIAKWSTNFEGYYQVWEWAKENLGKMVTVGLTATPQLLTDYVSPWLDFVDVTEELEPKHKASKISVCGGVKLETFLKGNLKELKGKTLVYTQSARECQRLSKVFRNSGFIVSKSNETIPDGEELPLNELMKQQVYEGLTLPDYLVEKREFPEEIEILFINDACSVGMNIHDAAVRNIVCDSYDIATIKQVQGRARHDIDNLFVSYQKYGLNNGLSIADGKLFGGKCGQEYLAAVYDAQIEEINSGGTPPQRVIKTSEDCYSTNPFYKALALYEGDEMEAVAADDMNYFTCLDELALDSYVHFMNAQKIRSKAAAAKQHKAMDWPQLLSFTNGEKWLTAKELKEICRSSGLLTGNGRKPAGVPTFVKLANESGQVSIENMGQRKRNGAKATWYRITGA